MRNFKQLTEKAFWQEKLQPLKEKLGPYLGPAIAKGRAWKAKAKTALYPYLRPAIVRYRRFEAKHPVPAKIALYTSALAAAGLFFILTFVFSVYIGLFGKLPSGEALRKIDHNIASEVWSADSVLLGKYFIENRLPSDIEEISPYIINALVTTEDARFFEHGGVDLRSWMRVLFVTILKRDESGGGGSTISQQLAKNLFPRKNHGIFTVPVAKVKEIFIARRLERQYDKNQLLSLYLNKVPFGEKVFGIRMATKRFFNTNPKDIKVEEAAVLVGMLKATTYYNPRRYPDRAQERRNTVLAQMVKYEKLDSAAYDSLSQLPLELKFEDESHDEGVATYFRENLRLELEKVLEKHTKPDGTPYNIYTDGLKIYTTIDSRMQRFAEEVVAEQMAKVQESFIKHFKGKKNVIPWGSEQLLVQSKQNSERYKALKKSGLDDAAIDSVFADTVSMTVFDWSGKNAEKDTLMTPLDSIKHYLTLLQTGFLAAEPQTGRVFAWVGGTHFKYFKYDHIHAKRQVGSTFKPIVFATALEEGFDPCELYENQLRRYENDYEPHNSDGHYGGYYSMRGALAKSVNVVAVSVLEELGLDKVFAKAQEMGITAKMPRELGIALGSADISLYEMVQAFCTFPNRGLKTNLYYLTRIETADGQVLFDHPVPDRKQAPRIFAEVNADIMNSLLQTVVDSGTARRIRSINNLYYPLAGKTGTTNDNTDGWFIGYAPTLITGAWVGAAQPAVHWHSTYLGQGGATALPICGHFLSRVYSEKEFANYRKKVFAPLSEITLAELDCPDFIWDDSLSTDSLHLAEMQEGNDQQELVRIIQDAFRTDGTSDAPAPAPKESEESERVRKQNEKLEKKRRRQEKVQQLKEKIKGNKEENR